ncbi:hypothetical protein BH09MYX1_BH09MYX1_43030 [soil metagenome]
MITWSCSVGGAFGAWVLGACVVCAELVDGEVGPDLVLQPQLDVPGFPETAPPDVKVPYTVIDGGACDAAPLEAGTPASTQVDWTDAIARSPAFRC